MKIGIVGAMDVEVADLIGAMQGARTSVHAKSEFHEGTIAGAECVVVKCGIAKVSAAVITQVLIDTYGVDCVINTGVAGSTMDMLGPCDMVVATGAVHHDMDVTPLGYKPGEIPGLPVVFEADPRLVKALAGALAGGDGLVITATVASGERFVASEDDRARIATYFGAACAEMEGAAVAQTCWLNDVPFAIVRAISDNADGTSSMAYPEFEAKAASAMAGALMKALPAIAELD